MYNFYLYNYREESININRIDKFNQWKVEIYLLECVSPGFSVIKHYIGTHMFIFNHAVARQNRVRDIDFSLHE